MLKSFTLTVDGTPASQGSKSIGHGFGGRATIIDGSSNQYRAKLHDWRTAVKAAGLKLLSDAGWPAPMDGPIEATIRFVMPRPTGKAKRYIWAQSSIDVDKLTRSTLDGLGPEAGKNQGGGACVIINDSRVCRLTVEKVWALKGEPTGATITMRLMDEPAEMAVAS